MAYLLSDKTRISSFAPTDYRREQSQYTESISYKVLPYAKLQKSYNSVIIGQKNPHLHGCHHKNADNAEKAGANLDFCQFEGQISLSDAQSLRLILPLLGDMSGIWPHIIACCLLVLNIGLNLYLFPSKGVIR